MTNLLSLINLLLAYVYYSITRLFCFLAIFLKDFLKYAPDGKISGNGPRAWRHQRWR
jgi:hypothetical protein